MTETKLSRRIREKRRVRRVVLLKKFRDVFLILSGIICASVGLKGFLLPNSFLDGGVTGISLLLNNITNVPLPILIVLINIPFLYISIKQVSHEFAFKASIAILTLSISVAFLEMPVITEDKLLIAVFGGFFLGAGIGLAIRGGAVIDGTEILAVYISKRSSLTIGDFIGGFNIILFVLSAFLINVETAMYSMLTYFAASRTVDFLIIGIEEYIGVTIISHRADMIQRMIIDTLGRGVTVYKGESGYGKSGHVREDRKIIYCVVTRLEVSKLLFEVNKIDEEAFIVQHGIKEAKGGMIRKRPLH